MKRIVGITIGDPAGIGPEIITDALTRILEEAGPDASRQFDFRLFGPRSALDRIEDRVSRKLPKNSGGICLIPTGGTISDVRIGRYSRASGLAAIDALDAAATELTKGTIDALVTGPISKLAFIDAGLDFPGQTEFVADRCKVRNWAMMLGGPRLKVALATTHLALRDVADAITAELVHQKILVCHDFMKNLMHIAAPRLAVTALNPHCGDGGRFGDEETEIIAPAVKLAVEAGLDVTGPVAADTCFHQAWEGRFDMVLAMYHDQGLGPLKLVHFQDAINVTMGLPRIRCSCDHGPAFDLAGGGTADFSSMKNAIRFACDNTL